MNTNHQNQINARLQNHPDQFSTGSSGNAKRASVYEEITERVITILENGVALWRKPWKAQGAFPRNLITGKPYRDLNVFLLHAMNYESPFWLTYRQAAQLGGNVRRGEKACPVVYWKQLEVVRGGNKCE
jgi:antirestriction protein ArdC